MTYTANIIRKSDFQEGNVYFDNVKTMKINFPFEFTKNARCSICLMDQSASVPYKLAETKSYLIVQLKSPYTGWLTWEAKGW